VEVSRIVSKTIHKSPHLVAKTREKPSCGPVCSGTKTCNLCKLPAGWAPATSQIFLPFCKGGGGRILRGSSAHTKLNHASSSAFFLVYNMQTTDIKLLSYLISGRQNICIMQTDESQALLRIISLIEVSQRLYSSIISHFKTQNQVTHTVAIIDCIKIC